MSPKNMDLGKESERTLESLVETSNDLLKSSAGVGRGVEEQCEALKGSEQENGVLCVL